MARKRSYRHAGTTVILEHDSRVLADNPLGDPHIRKLAVWLPPGYDEGRRAGRPPAAAAAIRCSSTSSASRGPASRTSTGARSTKTCRNAPPA